MNHYGLRPSLGDGTLFDAVNGSPGRWEAGKKDCGWPSASDGEPSIFRDGPDGRFRRARQPQFQAGKACFGGQSHHCVSGRKLKKSEPEEE
jgi:hypothetical protein